MPNNERLRVAIPNGELKYDVFSFLKAIGLRFELPRRNYLISVSNMPLDLLLIRASDVPMVIRHKNSTVGVGITGSDLIWNSGMQKDEGMQLPVNRLIRNAKFWSLYIGVKHDFSRKIKDERHRSVLLADLSGTTLATKYTYVAQEYFTEQSIPNVDIFRVGGTDEAIPFAFPNCFSILGVTSSDATRQANSIDLLNIIHRGTVRMIEEASKLSTLEQAVLDDIRDRIEIAVQKTR